MKKPLCRLWVFSYVPSNERKRRGMVQAAWQDWHESARDEARDARLPGAGSFYWDSPRDAWRRARVLMRQYPLITHVKVETIGGRPVGRMWRTHAYAAGPCSL
jgi:hypothetical protein